MLRKPLPALCLAACLVATLAMAAFAAPLEPRRVSVELGPNLPAEALLVAGLDVVTVKHGAWAEILEWPGDEAKLARLGAVTRVLDEHVSTTLANRAKAELSRRPAPAPARVKSAIGSDGAFRIESLPPFGSGSMGGFWTLDEVKMKLDSLVASDPNDLVADKLDTIGTSVQGRPIWGLKIGRHVTGPDPRPVVFYNALTHAREPEGMQALFWFVDDLLGRYLTDPFARYLLDQRVLYIVPVVNPDGYRLNQTLFPGGGGLHRKNLRDTDSDAAVDYRFDGVDLNRNYGFQWALNDTGSSGTSTNETYRGDEAFSEPETQAQRDLVAALQPKTAISFHTYSDLFLHPWGWTAVGTPDSSFFYELNDEATLGNAYSSGASPRVLYAVNGEFNDWCYGDTITKPRAWTWTPEAGGPADDFWPPPSRIVPIAQENLRNCTVAAAVAGPWVRIESASLVEGTLDAGNVAHVAVTARNRGLAATPANLSARMTALNAGTEVFPSGTTVPYPALAARTSGGATGGATFLIAAHDSVTPGRLVRFQVDFTADNGYFSRDTVEVLVGRPTVLLVEPANDFTNFFTAGGWTVILNHPQHLSRFFADSPGNYPANMNARLIYKGRLNLTAGVHAWALFESRWNYETDWDGARLEASFDSVTWVPLTARATIPARSTGGGGPLPPEQPAWTGARWNWAGERADLSPFTGAAGSAVRLRLRSLSDTGSQTDGMSLDSLRILLFDPAQQPAPAAVGEPSGPILALAAPSPNPAHDEARLGFTLPRAARVRLAVHDLQGRVVRVLGDGTYAASRYELGWDLRDDAGRAVAPGIYLVRLSGEMGTIARRLAVLR